MIRAGYSVYIVELSTLDSGTRRNKQWQYLLAGKCRSLDRFCGSEGQLTGLLDKDQDKDCNPRACLSIAWHPYF